MMKLSKHRQMLPGNGFELSLQSAENCSCSTHATDGTSRSSSGIASGGYEKHEHSGPVQSSVQEYESQQLAVSNGKNVLTAENDGKTYAAVAKRKKNTLHCTGETFSENSGRSGSVIDINVKEIMEMTLNEILSTNCSTNASEVSSYILHSTEDMMKKELIKKILPKAVLNAVKHFATGANQVTQFKEETSSDEWAGKITGMWKSRIKIILDNLNLSDDDNSEEENVDLRNVFDTDLPFVLNRRHGEVCNREGSTLENMPMFTDGGTQTISTGKVVYLKVYTDSSEEKFKS